MGYRHDFSIDRPFMEGKQAGFVERCNRELEYVGRELVCKDRK